MNRRSKTYDLVYVAVFAVLITICSWLSIPTYVPFTMQTFAIFLTMGVLGGKRGTLSILVYILLGAVGIPVFSEFTGGIGIIMGTTGGYLIGFIFCALLMWAMEAVFGKKPPVFILSAVLGMIVYFTFGTVWFMAVYARTIGPVGLTAVLGWCVLPFIIPDIVKMALAFVLSRRLTRIMDRSFSK